MTTESPALALFRLVLRRWGSDKWARSWTRLNGSLADAVRLAITAGLRWDPEDFGTMMRESGLHIPGEVETYRTSACACGNASAADAFDHYQGRKAINVGKWWHYGKPHESGIGRLNLRRVYIGFSWWEGGVMGTPEEGELYTVTSFADDGESVIACSHYPYEAGKPAQIKSRRTFDRSYFSPPIPPEETKKVTARVRKAAEEEE